MVDSGYTADKDDLVVDASGADDPIDHEISTTGYVSGWGNAGRHALTAAQAWAVDEANDRAEFDAGDPATWTTFGPSGTDVDALIVIKEGGANDTTSRLIAYIDTVSGSPSLPYTPTGGDLAINLSAEGLIHLTT